MTNHQSLLYRYQNQIYLIDDNNLMGIFLYNETEKHFKKLLVLFKYSPENLNNKLCLIKFAKHYISKKYDWKLYGKPEWEALKPKKKKKFIKPKTYQYENKKISN